MVFVSESVMLLYQLCHYLMKLRRPLPSLFKICVALLSEYTTRQVILELCQNFRFFCCVFDYEVA